MQIVDATITKHCRFCNKKQEFVFSHIDKDTRRRFYTCKSCGNYVSK